MCAFSVSNTLIGYHFCKHNYVKYVTFTYDFESQFGIAMLFYTGYVHRVFWFGIEHENQTENLSDRIPEYLGLVSDRIFFP